MKRYTVRYYQGGAATTTAVSNWTDLNDYLKGLPKGTFVQTRTSENMPKIMSDLIEKHNQETLTGNSLPPSNNQEL